MALFTQSIERSVRKFNRQMNAATKDMTETQLVKFHKKTSFEALRGIIELTAVDTGRARANWQTTNRTPAKGTVPYPSKGKIPEGRSETSILSQTVAAGAAAIAKIKPFSVLWITNNLDYIIELEYGSSTQNNREGMVRKTLNRLSDFNEK